MKNIVCIAFLSIFIFSCNNEIIQIKSNFNENNIEYLVYEYNNIITYIINNDKDLFIEYFKYESEFYGYFLNLIANKERVNIESFLSKYNLLIENIPIEINDILKNNTELNNIEYKCLINFHIIMLLYILEGIHFGEINNTSMNSIFSNINIANINKIKKIFSKEDIKLFEKHKNLIINETFLKHGRI